MSGTQPVRVTSNTKKRIEAIGKRLTTEGMSDVPPRYRKHLEKRAVPASHASVIAAAVAEMLEAIDPKLAEKLRAEDESE
jgi:hypothetical protein